MIVRASSILIAVVAAGCGAQSSGSAGASGVAGIVRISPASPVCRTGSTCSRPAKHFRLVFSRDGHSVVATTDAKGRYRVKLERGRYAVRAASGRNTGPKQGLQPSTVTVPRGRFAEQAFIYDAGIR